MSDLVAFETGNMPNLSNFAGNLAKTSAGMRQRTGVPILRLLKSGDWVYGSEQTEPDPESEWAINPYSLSYGYISWSDDSRVVGEHMVSMGEQTMPTLDDVGPAPGQPWQEQRACQMQCVAGEDDGQTVVYKGTALGLLDAFDSFVPLIASRMTAGEDFVPVVRLENTSYQHKVKAYGRIYKPVLTIVRWVGMDADASEEPEEEEVVEKPVRRRGRGRGA